MRIETLCFRPIELKFIFLPLIEPVSVVIMYSTIPLCSMWARGYSIFLFYGRFEASLKCHQRFASACRYGSLSFSVGISSLARLKELSSACTQARTPAHSRAFTITAALMPAQPCHPHVGSPPRARPHCHAIDRTRPPARRRHALACTTPACIQCFNFKFVLSLFGTYPAPIRHLCNSSKILKQFFPI